MQQIASSGEAEVWQTQLAGYLAKVYHSPSLERIEKLEVMIAHPPQDPNAHLNHISFAWPKSLLYDARGHCVGFLMPQVANTVDLLNVYNPRCRQALLPGFDWRYLHVTALNIASIVWAIHAAGYVIGDIKPQNILVSNRALPTVIDTDSFQVRHPQNGRLYPCLVGSEGFTPVELIGTDLATVEQTEIHDRFRLGVIIYLLLFGEHPFKGRWMGAGDSPPPHELLRLGFWPYAPNSPIQPSPLTIPLNTIHPALQRCFLRCFNEGHANPARRPSPQEWVQALKIAVTELRGCKRVKRHYYSKSHVRCHWCDRKAKLGIDIFPGPPSVAEQLAKKYWQPTRQVLDTAQQKVTQRASDVQRRLLKGKKAKTQPLGRGAHRPVPQPTLVASIGKPQPPHSRPSNWLRLGATMGSIGGGLALLSILSSAHMNEADIQLTAVGVLLCLGLVGIALLWLKVLKQHHS
jgi:DNA-binding helix-hairpin-helix protein with protein kinase domain